LWLYEILLLDVFSLLNLAFSAEDNSEAVFGVSADTLLEGRHAG